jgi:hypothetical protein
MPIVAGGTASLQFPPDQLRRGEQFEGEGVGTRLGAGDAPAAEGAVYKTLHEMGVGSKRDVDEQGINALVHCGCPKPVQHGDDARPHPGDRVLAWFGVVDQEVGDLMGDCEASLVGRVIGVQQDHAPAGVGN